MTVAVALQCRGPGWIRMIQLHRNSLLHQITISDSFARATHPTIVLAGAFGGVAADGAVGATFRRLDASSHAKNSSRTLAATRSNSALPIAQPISHTLCRSAAHPEEDEEVVLVVDEVASLPVEVCSSRTEAL
jgi:hypothetical protein